MMKKGTCKVLVCWIHSYPAHTTCKALGAGKTEREKLLEALQELTFTDTVYEYTTYVAYNVYSTLPIYLFLYLFGKIYSILDCDKCYGEKLTQVSQTCMPGRTVPSHPGWSERAPRIRWYLSRGMQAMRTETLQTPGSRRVQGRGIINCKGLGAGARAGGGCEVLGFYSEQDGELPKSERVSATGWFMFEKEPCRCCAETDRPWGRERREAVAPAPVAEVASSS